MYIFFILCTFVEAVFGSWTYDKHIVYDEESYRFKPPISLETDGELNYKFYPVSLKHSQLKFSIKAPSDAHVLLITQATNGDPKYEIIIAGWGNSRSAICKNNESNAVRVETPNFLSADQYHSFWIKWASHTIVVGKYGEKHSFMKHTDPKLFNVTYYGVGTGSNATGEWKLLGTSTAPIHFSLLGFKAILCITVSLFLSHR